MGPSAGCAALLAEGGFTVGELATADIAAWSGSDADDVVQRVGVGGGLEAVNEGFGGGDDVTGKGIENVSGNEPLAADTLSLEAAFAEVTANLLGGAVEAAGGVVDAEERGFWFHGVERLLE